MKKIIISLLSLLIWLPTEAQIEIETLLIEIENNNRTLMALRDHIEAEKLGNKTAIYLPNPEVEYTHLRGNPSEIGNEITYAVSQSLDFPTAYIFKNKISGLKNENLETLYRSERLNILLAAKQYAIELTYYNALLKDYKRRVETAQIITDSYQKKYDEQGVNAIERNNVYMNLIASINAKEKIEIERNAIINRLKALNGGQEIIYEESEIFITPLPSNFTDWYNEAESLNPELQYLNKQINISKEQVKLNKALGLPKLSAGYVDERVLGEKMRGITVGISIPLWENKNIIKQAKAEVRSHESLLADNKIQFFNRLEELFQKSVTLLNTALQYRNALATYNNESLLRKALESGEISLLTYLLEIEFYYDAFNNMLEVERDYAISVAELTAITL